MNFAEIRFKNGSLIHINDIQEYNDIDMFFYFRCYNGRTVYVNKSEVNYMEYFPEGKQ